MPNRIIKESICKSETLNRLSADEEVFFYRLLVNCDDYGRFSADPDLLASLLYPRRRTLRSSSVESWLHALANAGLVILYRNNGDMLLQVATWDKHQQIRNKRSKYPAFTDDGSEVITETGKRNHLKSSDSNTPKTHLKSNDSKCPRNPIQSNLNPNPNPIQSDTSDDGRKVDGFDLFWSVYPKRVGKKDAIKAWGQIKPDEETAAAIVEGVERWNKSDQWTKEGGQYIPYPATFLRGERWNDECQPAIVKKAPAEKNYDDDEDFLKG